MTPSSVQLASRITSKQIVDIARVIETTTANMHAVGTLFTLIESMTAEFAVVQPLSESGEKIANNIAEDLAGVMDKLNAMLVIAKGTRA